MRNDGFNDPYFLEVLFFWRDHKILFDGRKFQIHLRYSQWQLLS